MDGDKAGGTNLILLDPKAGPECLLVAVKDPLDTAGRGKHQKLRELANQLLVTKQAVMESMINWQTWMDAVGWLVWYVLGASADELVVLSGGGEHDDGDLRVAEHGELLGLLHDPRPALGVGHLPVGGVLDPLYLDLPPPHRSRHLQLIQQSRALGQSDHGELARAGSTDAASLWGGNGEGEGRRLGSSLEQLV